jgi:hypothetical protein
LEIERDEYEFYLRNEAAYLAEWEKIKSGQKPTFNLYAFLFGLFWMLYRKMYFVIFLVLGVLMVEVVLESILLTALGSPEGIASGIRTGLNVIFAVVLGMNGNRLYLFNAERKIKKIRKKNLPEEAYLMALYRAGGTTFIPHIIIALVMAAGILYFGYTNN